MFPGLTDPCCVMACFSTLPTSQAFRILQQPVKPDLFKIPFDLKSLLYVLRKLLPLVWDTSKTW